MPPVGFDYYAALARTLTPVDLAQLAVRRAYRMARRNLYKRDSTEPFAAVLSSHGATSAVDLPKAALDRPGRAHCDLTHRPRVLAALSQVPGAIDRALARAEAAAARRFRFLGTDFLLAPDGSVNTSLDPVNGHCYPLLPSERLVLLRGGMDPKLPWAIGRMDQLIALAQGAWVSSSDAERDRFAAAFASQATEFLQANPPGLGIQWTCPMEVALRAANLAQALRMLADAPPVRDPGFLALALGSLAEHTRFVDAHLEDAWAVPNNHLVSNLTGLLVVSALFPGLPEAPGHTAVAVRGLEAQLKAQVHSDGCSFEGSVSYHRLSVELFTLAYVVARACGISLSTAFGDRLALMYRAVEGYCTETGRAPQLGDNDSGRAFPLADRESLDHGYLLPLGAALFCDGRLKRPGATALSDEAAWLLGASGLGRFEALEPRPAPRRFISRRAGWAVVKQDGAYLAVSAGRTGQGGVGGHSHNDALSFELHLHGRPLIVDPGTYCYSGDPVARNAFRGTAAHNTLEIDGEEINPVDPARLFALPDRARAELEVFEVGPARARLSASHRGYQSLSAGGVVVERTFVLDRGARALSVVDSIRGRGVHRLVSRLHLEDRRGRLRPVTPGERARALRIPQAPLELSGVLLEIGDPAAPEALVLFEPSVRPELKDAEYSPGYGEKRPALVLELHRALRAPGRMGVVVLLLG